MPLKNATRIPSPGTFFRAHGVPVLTAGVVVLTGLFLHLRYYPIGNLGVETDFYGDMAVAARKLALGQFAVADYPHKGPLYPLLLAGMHFLGHEWYRAGVLLNLISAAGSIFLIWRMCGRLFSRAVASATVVFVALNYTFFVDAHKATSDHLFFLLCLGSMELLLRPSRTAWTLTASGGAAALAFLTRYNGAFLAVASLLIILWVAPQHRDWKPRLQASLFWAGSFLLLSSPWLAMQFVQTGHLLSTQNFGNISREFYTDPRFPNRPPEEIRSIGQLIGRDPWRFFTHYLSNLPRHLWNDLLYIVNPFASVLVILGLLRVCFRPRPREQWAFYIFAMIYCSAMALVFYLPRFRFLPALAEFTLAFSMLFGDETGHAGSPAARSIPFAGNLIRTPARILDRILRSVPGGRTGLGLFLSSFLMLPMIWTTVGIERANYHDRPLYMLPAAAFLRTYEPHPEGLGLMALKPHLPFLAGMRYQGYPWEIGSYGGFLHYVQDTGVRYVCLGELERNHVPGLLPLALPDSLPGLVRIYRTVELSLYRVSAGMDPEAAEAAWDKAAATPRSLPATGSDTEAAMEEARRLADQGRWAEAEALLRRTLDRAQELDQSVEGRRTLRALRGNLAVLWLEMKKNQEAVTLLRENLQDLSRSEPTPTREDQVEIAQTLALLALHEERLGRREDAVRHTREAAEAYTRLGEPARAKELLERHEGQEPR